MTDVGKEFLGRGWAFPIALEFNQSHIATAEYENDIEQSIYIILSTAPGERVMRPDFGCGIHELVFSAISASLVTNVKTQVEEALRRYEARIDVLRVDVDASQSANGRLLISLDYENRTTNQSGNFVFPFYFKEAF